MGAQGCGEFQETVERFWVDVSSVTVFGTVTGMPLSQLYWAPVRPGVLVFFSSKAIIGMNRGPHWDEEAAVPEPAASTHKGTACVPHVD